MHKSILDNLLLINHSNMFRPLSRSHHQGVRNFVTLKDFELPDDGFDWGAETFWSDWSVISYPELICAFRWFVFVFTQSAVTRILHFKHYYIFFKCNRQTGHRWQYNTLLKRCNNADTLIIFNTVFPQQQRSRERASSLRHTWIACLVFSLKNAELGSRLYLLNDISIRAF